MLTVILPPCIGCLTSTFILLDQSSKEGLRKNTLHKCLKYLAYRQFLILTYVIVDLTYGIRIRIAQETPLHATIGITTRLSRLESI